MCVFGAGGFIGRGLVDELDKAGYSVVVVSRQDSLPFNDKCKVAVVPNLLDPNFDWSRLLSNCKTVFNLVGAAHTGSNDYEFYYSSNVATAIRIAEICVKVGVERLVHVSSIKAVAKTGVVDSSMEKIGTGNPDGLYGLTKAFAEMKLAKRLHEEQVKLLICRLPLVYGYGAKANLKTLNAYFKWSPIFFFGALSKRREMLSLNNCSSLLIASSEVDDQSNSTLCFNFTNGGRFSMADLENLFLETGQHSRIRLRISLSILYKIFKLINKLSLYEKLSESIEVDPGLIRTIDKKVSLNDEVEELKNWLAR